jgi:hypothetical protein
MHRGFGLVVAAVVRSGRANHLWVAWRPESPERTRRPIQERREVAYPEARPSGPIALGVTRMGLRRRG